MLLLALAASGILDPLGHLIIESIPLPGPGEKSGFLLNAARFVTAWWFLGCIWFLALVSLVAVAYVAFDTVLTKSERFAWALSFLLGQYVTVILYCVLGLLALRKQSTATVA